MQTKCEVTRKKVYVLLYPTGPVVHDSKETATQVLAVQGMSNVPIYEADYFQAGDVPRDLLHTAKCQA